MNQDVMLYFRSVTDEDNDDNNGTVTSAVFPASRLRGMNPVADGSLALYFDSMKNMIGADDQDDEVTVADKVLLTVTTHRHKEVMEALIRKINGMKSNSKAEGFLVVADNVVTNAANATVPSVYFNKDVTACGTITVKAPFTGA